MTHSIITLLLGLALLYAGGEWLIKGSAGLARQLGVRPLIVGLTVVAYGTSAPELFVSGIAAWRGRGAIAVGNVVGSNIANLGMVLGIAALVAPLPVQGTLVRRELRVMLAATLALPLLLIHERIGRLEGALLLFAAAAFTIFAARTQSPADGLAADVVEQDAETSGAPHVRGWLGVSAVALAGLVLLLGGGELLVRSAVTIAVRLGVSDRVIGLTVVAVGTSLPELTASIIAGARGHADLALGNVVGSNIFNIVFVLGAAALVRPITIPANAFQTDLMVLLAFSVLGALLISTGGTVNRAKGALLAASYAIFLSFLVWKS